MQNVTGLYLFCSKGTCSSTTTTTFLPKESQKLPLLEEGSSFYGTQYKHVCNYKLPVPFLHCHERNDEF